MGKRTPATRTAWRNEPFAVIGVLVLASLTLCAQDAGRKQSPNIELHLHSGELINGLPETFTFIFENVSDHEVRLPPMTPCFPGRYVGRIKLNLDFSPLHPPIRGGGGGCGGGGSHAPKLLDQAKAWKLLRPGESLSVTFSRKQLFVIQEAPGHYDFWAEYEPPQFSAEEQAMLEKAGIDFPRAPLASAHLKFDKRQ